MPELPEVETIVRDLSPEVTGRTITSARLSHHDVLRGVSARTLTRQLRGRTFHHLFRRAKHAVFDMGDRRLVVQPGMTGSLMMHPEPLEPAVRQYAVLAMNLDDHRVLVYRDVRRLGTLLLLDRPGWDAYDESLGPEPLEDGWTAEVQQARFARSRQAVKKVLMDQRVVVGVGNIYANEALFRAGIDPSKPANQLTDGEHRLLHHEVVSILEAAIRSQGTTVRDYRTGTGESGTFQLELEVYGREGEPCRRCGTPLAGTHSIDARITVFCWRCQR